MMDIQLLRLDNYFGGPTQSPSCRGALYIDGVLFAWTMEDVVRQHKVKGKTAINAGTYEIKYRDDPASPKNQHYRNKYDWFLWHLWLQKVPNFKYVYIHIGNRPEDSEGCILVNSMWNWDKPYFTGGSTPYFKKFYLRVKAALDRGEKVEITIKNVFESVGQEILKTPQA